LIDSSAKIIICFKDGTFEIRGSEKFVAEQIENLKGLITEYFKKGEEYVKYFDTRAGVDPGDLKIDEIEYFKKSEDYARYFDPKETDKPEDLKTCETEHDKEGEADPEPSDTKRAGEPEELKKEEIDNILQAV
jgi:hypothetical protein